jgi:transglutaminase-like putative cysteine protease
MILSVGTAPPLPDSPNLPALRERLRIGETDEDLRAFEFAFDSPLIARSAELAAYARQSIDDHKPFLGRVDEFMHRIHSEFTYDPTVTTISTPVSEVLKGKQGVCQDFAHLMVAALRSLGVAARYVSGYLVPAPEVVGAQASHAWASVYCPGAGWCDFDPTNDTRPAHGHITVAWGRDFSDVSPLRGVMVGGGEHTVTVEVKVAAA